MLNCINMMSNFAIIMRNPAQFDHGSTMESGLKIVYRSSISKIQIHRNRAEEGREVDESP